jgi:hypothetical protein
MDARWYGVPRCTYSILLSDLEMGQIQYDRISHGFQVSSALIIDTTPRNSREAAKAPSRGRKPTVQVALKKISRAAAT